MPKFPVVRYLRRVRERSRREDTRPRCGFVLSGGGVFGAEQVGMMRALIEAGFVPDVISAVSVGALNAAAIAQDPSLLGVERLEHIYRDSETYDLFPGGLHRAISLLRRRDHLCENDGLARLIE